MYIYIYKYIHTCIYIYIYIYIYPVCITIVASYRAQPWESLSITYQQKGAWATQRLEKVLCSELL